MNGRRSLISALLGTLVGLAGVVSGCARERTDWPATMPTRSPSAADRAAEARSRLQAELSSLSDSSARDVETAKSDLQSRVLEQQSRIASLSADLQSTQASVASQREVVESRAQKVMALRQDQMREIAASIRTNDEILAARERELRVNQGATGESYEGDENLNSLKREIGRLRARGLELRSAYASLADENRSAIDQSTSAQQSLVIQGQKRQSDLAASITAAQADLTRLQEQSRQIDADAQSKKARADQLRAELAMLGE